MLNHIVICGRLTADPELRHTQSGVDVCSFTLAVDRDYKNGDEKVADFFTVTAWRGTAKFVSSYFAKGRMAIVEGSMESRKYEDKEGNKRTAWDVQAKNVYFADSKRDVGGGSAPAQNGGFEEVSDDDEEVSGDGDELPF